METNEFDALAIARLFSEITIKANDISWSEVKTFKVDGAEIFVPVQEGEKGGVKAKCI